VVKKPACGGASHHRRPRARTRAWNRYSSSSPGTNGPERRIQCDAKQDPAAARIIQESTIVLLLRDRRRAIGSIPGSNRDRAHASRSVPGRTRATCRKTSQRILSILSGAAHVRAMAATSKLAPPQAPITGRALPGLVTVTYRGQRLAAAPKRPDRVLSPLFRRHPGRSPASACTHSAS
jgi:hypothetical protein